MNKFFICSSEEATSSVEIDSATDPNTAKNSISNSESYVSTSESAEPTSRAQVLEELRARIRELEDHPRKPNRQHTNEDNYKCFICKVSFCI